MADSNTNTTSNTYQLFLYTDKVGSSDEGLKINTSYNWIVDEKNYDAKLTKLSYTKHVYAPCEISVQIDVSVKSSPGTNDGTKMPDNKKLVDSFLNKKVDLKINSNLIATNYFVYKVRPIYKTTSSSLVSVELSIFSADKLMTLDKYSRAYTAKKLYSDILAEESKKFNLKDSSNTSLSTLVANHMQLLKYKKSETKDGTTKDWTERDELRIPYVVQYNESFYQFMVRTANRFGEFLYFEDGNLNLGMQPSETNYYQRDDKGDIVKNDKNENIIIDWATEPNAVQSRYYESVVSEGIDVEERGYSYMTHKPDENEQYPDSAEGRFNPDPTSANEWMDQNLKENSYIGFNEALEEELKCFAIESIFKGLESQTLGEAITAIVMELYKKIYDVHRNNQDYNNLLDDANYNTIENDDQKVGNKYKQFVTYAGSINLSNNLSKMFNEDSFNNFTDLFYQFIRKKEKEVGEQTVWLDFGNFYRPIKLGDMLRVANKDYVAISVEGSYVGGQEHLLISAIPIFSLTETTPTAQTPTTAGDPWTTSCPFPPALSDVFIRDARPQVAFVAENLDPENLGRIRVRYPWQDADGDMSPWIRVTLPLATQGGAVNFTPNEGDEVMVGYVHGNIEHPYGMGYLVAPFVNEKWKNAIPLDQYGGVHGIKVKTGHHLTFTDGANAATLVASALGPLNFVKSFWPTGAVGAWPYGNENSADFGGGFELSDRYGFYKITGSTDDRNITIESPVGTVNLNAFQGISIEAPNGDIEIKGKNVSIEASNRMSLSSGENIAKKLWYQDAEDAVVMPEISGTLLTLKDKLWDQFVDMSFLRCVLEWFLVPVNGTLKIKSETFVAIEAGEGTTEVPADSLRYGKGYDSNANIKDKESINKVPMTACLIVMNVKALVDKIHAKYDAVCDATAAFKTLTGPQKENANEIAITYDTVINKTEPFTEDDKDFKWEEANLVKGEVKTKEQLEKEFKDKKYTLEELEQKATENILAFANNQEIDKKKKKIVEVSEALRKAVDELTTAVTDLQSLDENKFDLYGKEDDLVETDTAVDIIKDLKFTDTLDSMSLDILKGKTYGMEVMKFSDRYWNSQKKAMSRYAVFNYISDLSSIEKDDSKIKSEKDTLNNDKWKEFVKSLNMHSGGILSGLSTVASFVNEHFNPLQGLIDDQAQWANGFKGKILLSDSENRTASFDDNLNLTYTKNRNYYEENLAELRTILEKI